MIDAIVGEGTEHNHVYFTFRGGGGQHGESGAPGDFPGTRPATVPLRGGSPGRQPGGLDEALSPERIRGRARVPGTPAGVRPSAGRRSLDGRAREAVCRRFSRRALRGIRVNREKSRALRPMTRMIMSRRRWKSVSSRGTRSSPDDTREDQENLALSNRPTLSIRARIILSFALFFTLCGRGFLLVHLDHFRSQASNPLSRDRRQSHDGNPTGPAVREELSPLRGQLRGRPFPPQKCRRNPEPALEHDFQGSGFGSFPAPSRISSPTITSSSESWAGPTATR